jgi:hypothetical protein
MKKTKIPWLNVAYGLSALVLIGMSLPWAKALDLGGRGIGIATYRGWNLIWLVIPALAAAISYVVAFRNRELSFSGDENSERKWLWAALISSILSLIVMIGFGISMLTSTDNLMLSKIPLIGFWITFIALIGVTGILARSLFGEKTLPKQVA